MVKRIGLTGGLSSGKTTAALIFQELGAYIIDADKLAHQTLEDAEVVNKIKCFLKQEDITDLQGKIERKKLGRIIFREEKKVKFLNDLIHPLVVRKINEEIDSLRAGQDIAVVDVPLLYEAHLESMFDQVIVVYLTEEKQVQRSLLRKNRLNKEDVALRMRYQLHLSEKLKLADYVIDNNNSLENTRKQIIEVWSKLKLKEDFYD